MSEINVPTTERPDSRSIPALTKGPSCAKVASSSVGPSVGKLSTIEIITVPLTSAGSIPPMPLMKGFNAILTGYLTMTLQLGNPFALAVTTYGLDSSSRRLLRSILISPAVPAVPITMDGIIRCESMSITLPMLQGAVRYSPEKIPPTEWSKYAKKTYMRTRPKRKSGTPDL